MEILKILMIGILGTIAVIMLRSVKTEFVIPATLAIGVVILTMLVGYAQKTVNVFTQLAIRSGLSDELFSGVLKIVGIGYLTEYSASLCSDAGCDYLAKKVGLAGKLAIFLMSISIIDALLDVVEALAKMGGSL